jgi:hypothetical protein|tara:strand:+ start:17054 stop:17179 length:126 start_codon:yes stop_codon:yes gene_type:complete
MLNPDRKFSVKEIEQDNNVSATAARGYLDKLYKLVVGMYCF